MKTFYYTATQMVCIGILPFFMNSCDSFVEVDLPQSQLTIVTVFEDNQSKIILQGQNLLTFTKFKDGDPEFTSSGFLPPLKIITAGVQLTF